MKVGAPEFRNPTNNNINNENGIQIELKIHNVWTIFHINYWKSNNNSDLVGECDSVRETYN